MKRIRAIKHDIGTVSEYHRHIEGWHQFFLVGAGWSDNHERDAAIIREYLTTRATYAQLGEKYGIARSRCRAIVVKALRSIRAKVA